MSAALSFIEYLFAGALALPWILILLPAIVPHAEGSQTLTALIAAPCLYAFGMIIDLGASLCLRWPQGVIRAKLRKKHHVSTARGISQRAAIIAASPELGKELAIRSTRDRIARAFWFNATVLSLVVAVYEQGVILGVTKWQVFAVTGVVSVLALRVWWRFESLTRRFKYRSFLTIDQLRLLGALDEKSGS